MSHPAGPRGLVRGPSTLILPVLLAALAVAGCGVLGPRTDDAAPWKSDAPATAGPPAVPTPTSPLTAANCPTLAAAQAAVPGLVSGPDANNEPFKTMILQCDYGFDELGAQLRPAGIGILVFDMSAEGVHAWDSVRDDPTAADVPGLDDVAITTGTPGHYDLFVIQGRFGFHVAHTRQGPVDLTQMVALARATLTALGS